MKLENVKLDKNRLDEIPVIVEIESGSAFVKYEFDKEVGGIVVDRFLPVSMYYPCNYGFIPNTKAGDGDPVDVLLITEHPINSGSLIKVRPIGVIIMEDEGGMDEKIICLPAKKLNSVYNDIETYEQLPKQIVDKITHFFERYKDLDKGKWVKISGFKDGNFAKNIISGSVLI